jgi:hypothetical protein
MTFHDVAADEHCMAARQPFGHAVLASDEGEIVGRYGRHGIAVLAQIGGVSLATAALWVLEQLHGRFFFSRSTTEDRDWHCKKERKTTGG